MLTERQKAGSDALSRSVSALYATRPRSLHHAVARVGLDALWRIGMSVCLTTPCFGSRVFSTSLTRSAPTVWSPPRSQQSSLASDAETTTWLACSTMWGA